MRRCSLLLASAISMPVAASAGTVRVLYAGSLVNVMEHGLAPAFDKSGSDAFEGYAGGSGALVNQIKGRLRRADVFISANPGLNAKLTGAANGDWVRWYVTFARSPLVIGVNPSSRFAADLRSRTWYQVLREPGIRIGRTDPALDPKGVLTVKLLSHAEQLHHQPGLEQAVLGAPDNPAQVLPEETLAGRLQSGQIDVGFFYSTEAADLRIPAITLPEAAGLGAQYTATILRSAADPAVAARFVAFLLGPGGGGIMKRHGLTVLPPVATGEADAIPKSVRAELANAR